MKFLKYLFDVLVYACCAVGVVLLILMALNFKFVSIKTGSMEPEIGIGDLCIIKELSEEDGLRQGDIVTFSAGDSYVTHRIISDNGDGTYTTKGDANKVYDEAKLTKDNIIGKVVYTVSSFGVVLDYISNSGGKLVLISGLGILVTVSLLLDMIVKKRENVKSKGQTL